MALVISIAGTDRTRLVDAQSLQIQNVLTTQVDTAAFTIKRFGNRSFIPTVGQEVVMTLDGSKVFAGRIVIIDEVYDKLDYVSYNVQCKDYTVDLDKKLVVEVYQNTTVNAIIAAIKASYMHASITTNNVNCPVEVDYIAFNYEYPSECLKRLAEIVGFSWYIDYDRDIHFFGTETVAAPFDLSDTGGKYIYDSLRLKKDITPIRNTIYVRGGEYLAETFTVETIADGTQNVFGTEYRMADLQVVVTGQQKSIGIDGIDEPTNYDLLFNFQEKLIKFRDNKIPTNTSGIKIIGRPYLPVLTKIRDNASIALFSASEGTDGIHEYKIIDKSIKSKEGARQRAKAELLMWAATAVEGEFRTNTNGLRSGQRIRVQSDLRSIDAYYVINRVTMRPVANAVGSTIQFEYQVQLVSSRTFDHIDMLLKLINRENREIEISDDEVLDEIETADEEVDIADSVAFTSEARGYQWGPGGVPQLYWGLGDWG